MFNSPCQSLGKVHKLHLLSLMNSQPSFEQTFQQALEYGVILTRDRLKVGERKETFLEEAAFELVFEQFLKGILARQMESVH